MYKALLIGVNEYENHSKHKPLPAVTHDLYRLFKILYSSDCHYSTQIVTSSATKYEYIWKLLLNFFADACDTDVLFLYWAGHGSYSFCEGGKLICYDSSDSVNSIDMGNVAKLINESSATAKFCVFDCCHSGALVRGEQTARLKINGSGTVIMMSSDYYQKSYEDIVSKKSFFTDLLIEGLEGNAAYHNGIVTPFSLHDYISTKIKKVNLPSKQTPVMDATIVGQFVLNICCPDNNSMTNTQVIEADDKSGTSVTREKNDYMNNDYPFGLSKAAEEQKESIVFEVSIEKLKRVFIKYEKQLSNFLTGYLRTECSVKLINIESIPFVKHMKSHDTLTIFGFFEANSLPAVLELSTNIAFSFVDRILGGDGVDLKIHRDFSEIELILIERIMSQCLSCLSMNNNHLFKDTLKIQKVEAEPVFNDFIRENENNTVIKYNIECTKTNVKGFINFCFSTKTFFSLIMT